MNVLDFREFCFSLPYVVEDFPFDEETLVFKVMGKMFLLIDLVSVPLKVSLKATQEEAVRLKEDYYFIQPGYHLNKKYWLTVELVDNIPNDLVYELIRKSYVEVVKKLPKYKQELIFSELNYGKQ